MEKRQRQTLRYGPKYGSMERSSKGRPRRLNKSYENEHSIIKVTSVIKFEKRSMVKGDRFRNE